MPRQHTELGGREIKPLRTLDQSGCVVGATKAIVSESCRTAQLQICPETMFELSNTLRGSRSVLRTLCGRVDPGLQWIPARVQIGRSVMLLERTIAAQSKAGFAQHLALANRRRLSSKERTSRRMRRLNRHTRRVAYALQGYGFPE
jgi:hypothetical protein